MFQVGDTWPSPDGDVCKNITCVETKYGKLEKEELINKCNKNCAAGWGYKEPSKESKQCCGQCEPEYCILNGEPYPIGSVWTSDDNCTKYTCTSDNSSLTIVTDKIYNCPSLDDCEPQFIVEDGCCSKCTKPKPGKCALLTSIGNKWSNNYLFYR